MKKNVKSIRTQLFAAVLCLLFLTPCTLQAEDHVMAATKSRQQREVPSSLTLSLKEAQDYAVEGNRSLRNASLAVQEAYAQRWQTIAAMLPQVDGSYTYSNYLGYSAEMSTAMGSFNINMPNVGALGVTASVGINGQGVVGALLNNIAIDMKKLSLEESETNIRSSITTSYVSVLIMNDISQLLDSSLSNIQALADITQKTVDAGAAEQTTADQIKVRINTLKNNINSTKRNTELAISSQYLPKPNLFSPRPLTNCFQPRPYSNCLAKTSISATISTTKCCRRAPNLPKPTCTWQHGLTDLP